MFRDSANVDTEWGSGRTIKAFTDDLLFLNQVPAFLTWLTGWLSKLIRSDAAFNCCKLSPCCKQALYLVAGAAPVLFAKRL